MSGWQPIETAPMDQEVLIWAAPEAHWHESVKGAQYVAEGTRMPRGHVLWQSTNSCCTDTVDGIPTHWQPLPEPPQ